MNIRRFKESDEKELIHLIGEYRVDLAELKGSKREIDLKAAQKELDCRYSQLLSAYKQLLWEYSYTLPPCQAQTSRLYTSPIFSDQ